MRNCLSILILAVLSFCASPSAWANESPETIAIIGTGNVGGALGTRWAAQGHRIIYGSRTPDAEPVQALVAEGGENTSAAGTHEAAQAADIIVLAVPWTATEATVAALGDVAGKIIIDPINASRFVEGRIEIGHPALAEAIAGWAPGAQVVKALNTTSYTNMANPPADRTITVPLAGDSDEAKARVARLVRALGLAVRDVGPLYNARYLEAMGNLYIYVNVMQQPDTRLEYSF
ncbi:MAG: NADPH-dependent F420 reductase [Gammaproteobacteria bacterium]|nr:NADPH-dependent F420 reductase [Gammaproteobacteria bacterium]